MEVSGQLHAPAALLPGKEPPVPIEQGAGLAPQPDIARGWREELLSCPCRGSKPNRPARSPVAIL